MNDYLIKNEIKEVLSVFKGEALTPETHERIRLVLRDFLSEKLKKREIPYIPDVVVESDFTWYEKQSKKDQEKLIQEGFRPDPNSLRVEFDWELLKNNPINDRAIADHFTAPEDK